MYKYVHDKEMRGVSKFDVESMVSKVIHRGKLTGWNLRMTCIITRADNCLQGNGKWKFATSDYPLQLFDSRY